MFKFNYKGFINSFLISILLGLFDATNNKILIILASFIFTFYCCMFSMMLFETVFAHRFDFKLKKFHDWFDENFYIFK